MKSTRSCNVLVVGQTGVGKSSLINYLTGVNRAAVGVGRPITTKDDVSSYPSEYLGVPVLLFDSWGIETDKVDDWKNRIKKIIGEHNGCVDDVGASWFHTIIYCIACGNSRIQPTDEKMINYFKKEGFSVIIALTKADLIGTDDLYKLKSSLPQGTICQTVSVGAKTRYGVSEPFGKKELFAAMIMETLSNLPTRLSLFLNGNLESWERKMRSKLWDFDISRFGNSDVENWINSSAESQLDVTKELSRRFVSEELQVLSKWSVSVTDVSVQYKLESLPEADEMSGGEIALAIAFAPIAIVGALIYGIFWGVEHERDKLREMISNASSQIKNFIDKRVASLKDELERLNM